ncbi:hypothetical protein [Thalassotalea marina]|uniref:hypothetical protein n=1 Tax=Thalassotalea marina TaxID=1673741 RepID=UPI0016741A45|nr:hypothetical protein [Thalassotalea marina]
MSMPHCKILPGEHTFSWMLRSYLASGEDDFLSFQKRRGIFDRGITANKIFCDTTSQLYKLLETNHGVYSNNLSLVPWQISTGKPVSELEKLISFYTHMNEQQMFSFSTDWHSCADCREEDLNHYGTSFWHAKHQITSSFRCYKHRCVLQTANPSIKNLYYEQLPHQNMNWSPLVIEPSSTIISWQDFIDSYLEADASLQIPLWDLKDNIVSRLNLPVSKRAGRLKVCQELNVDFEKVLGDKLLRYLFRDFARPTERGSINILRTMFAGQHKSHGVRNYVYWLALYYWLENR